MNLHIAASATLCAACLALPRPAAAATLEVPLGLDYAILQQALAEQVFTGEGRTAEVFADGIRCNRLELSEPQVEGSDDERLRLRVTMRAQTGTPLGGKCRFAKTWNGLVETRQTVRADPETSALTFRVVDSALLDAESGEPILPGFMENWIEQYVHPRLAAVTVDLAPAVSGIGELLELVVADDGASGSTRPGELRLSGARADPDKLVAILSLEVPDAPATPLPAEAPFTDEELARWDASWQAWDAFATWTIMSLAERAGEDLTRALAETLLKARYDLRDALARDEPGRDAVRTLFLQTWERLAPLVSDIQLGVPGAEALPYAAFISAGDALQALDLVAPHLGWRLDVHAFRRMARLLAPDVDETALRYETRVDPDLREVLGLDPEFDTESGDDPGTGGGIVPWLFAIIADARAAQIQPELLRQLNRWVPERREVDRYLLTVDSLLDAIARAERERDKVPAVYQDLHDALLRATAWQESCWRQYVVRDGSVQTIRSAAGSVGLMQVNLAVWRGVYDPDELMDDVGYNARAGNEILVHYLVDYALRKGEHELSGDPGNLARATYAAYNGGPGHLARYRKPGTAASLRKIDNAFWAKYRAIQAEGASAVKSCLAG